MSKLQSPNSKALQVVDCWPYDKKVIKYSGDKPIESLKRMLPCPTFGPSQVVTDGQGNIINMPPLIGRPCFAVPTAYLRERCRPDQLDPKSGILRPASKCLRCNVSGACNKVVTERLQVIATEFPDFKKDFDKWNRADGFTSGGFTKAIDKLGEAGWRNVYRWPQKVLFTSSNDNEVQSYWNAKSDSFSKTSARARAAELRANWKDGSEMHLLIDGLEQGRLERLTLLQSSLTSGATPAYLVRLPVNSAERISYTWWGREFARLTGAKINPNRIAKLLIGFRRNLGICESSLRSSVKYDLERISKLESSAQYNGGMPIWPKFIHPRLAV